MKCIWAGLPRWQNKHELTTIFSHATKSVRSVFKYKFAINQVQVQRNVKQRRMTKVVNHPSRVSTQYIVSSWFCRAALNYTSLHFRYNNIENCLTTDYRLGLPTHLFTSPFCISLVALNANHKNQLHLYIFFLTLFTSLSILDFEPLAVRSICAYANDVIDILLHIHTLHQRHLYWVL